jgi:hypothetical protein
MHRCAWAKTELSIAYHDHEWGTPTHDEATLFEVLALTYFENGLSWATVFDKRANLLITRLRALQVPGVHLGVGRRNTRAISFYEHVGFQVIKSSEGGIRFGMHLEPSGE